MLVASMNPCPCGFYGSNQKECSCSEKEMNKYMHKVSGPLLDRIDIQIEVQNINFEKYNQHSNETSAQIKFRVEKARNIQKERYKHSEILTNSELTNTLIEKYCTLDNESKTILEKASQKLNLSSRGYFRILKVARTIADLEQSEKIKKNHIAEAIQYRNLDKKYF